MPFIPEPDDRPGGFGEYTIATLVEETAGQRIKREQNLQSGTGITITEMLRRSGKWKRTLPHLREVGSTTLSGCWVWVCISMCGAALQPPPRFPQETAVWLYQFVLMRA